MLKTLLGISRKELTPIINCFKLLDNYQSGLAEDIAKYIYDGQPAAALKSLELLNKDQLFEAGIWSPRYYHSSNISQKQQKELSKIDKSFESFYDSEILADIDICRRWGAVRALCMDVQGKTLHHRAIVPDWFAAIFLEIGTSRYRGYSNVKVAKHYTGPWLIELAQKHDLDFKVWLPVLCEMT